MKVLVTGGYGQIGSHIVELLLARGDEVLAIDNLATGLKEHLAAHANLTSVFDTIAEKKLVDALVGDFKPEVVVHTAASYKDPTDWYNDSLTNVVGGSNVVNAAKANNVRRLIYFQTSLCYGLKPLHQPIRLDHPKFPGGSSYAISKTANEDYIALSGIDYVTFRLANVVGPRNNAGPLPIFYQRLKDGKKCFVTKSRRDFVFVKDLARTVIRAIDGVGRGTYHFSSGTDIAIKELYDAVVKAMCLPNYPEPDVRDIGPDDVFSILLDPSRTFADFGQPEFTPLDETVAQAVAYYDRFGTMGEFTHLKLQDKK